MKPFDTQDELLDFYNITNLTELNGSEIFRRHLYNGRESQIVGAYTAKTSNKGFVLKVITDSSQVLTLDKTGEIRGMLVGMVPSDADAIIAIKQNAADYEKKKGDIEVKKAQSKAKNAEERAKAAEKETRAIERWWDAWWASQDADNKAKLKQAISARTSEEDKIGMAAILLHNDLMVIVSKMSEPTILTKERRMSSAREKITKLINKFVEDYKTQPRIPPRNKLTNALKEFARSATARQIPFGKIIEVDDYVKKVKYKKKEMPAKPSDKK